MARRHHTTRPDRPDVRERPATALVAAAVVLLTTAPAAAAEGDTTATFAGTQDGSTAVASTSTGESGGEADVLRIGDSTIIGGSTGYDGSSSGEVATTGDTELGSATVGGWSATHDGSGGESDASLLSATLGSEDELGVSLFDSSTSSDGTTSTSRTSGVELVLDDTTVHVLTVGDEDPEAALLAVDDTTVVDDDQADDGCSLSTPDGEGSLTCLAHGADGEDGSDDSNELEAQAGALGGVVVASTSAAADGAPAQDHGSGGDPAPAPDAGAGDSDDADDPRPTEEVAGAGAARGTLPRTGADLLTVLLLALLAVATGRRLLRDPVTAGQPRG